MSAQDLFTIVFENSAWESLLSHLDESSETAWTMLARAVGKPDKGDMTLLVREVMPVPQNCYEEQTASRLSITSSGWLPTFSRATNEESVPIFVHTHPGHSPQPSVWDNKVDSELSRVASNRVQPGLYASLIIGGTSDNPLFSGRLYYEGVKRGRIDRLRIVGQRLHLLISNKKTSTSSLPFDRQVIAFGEVGQEVLSHLRIGVVGAGGTGSAVIEQLVRLGVGEILVADPEKLTITNVTRVYGSSLSDVGRLKVDIAASSVRRIGLKTKMITKAGSVLEKTIAQAFAHCDMVFGCTDDNAGRVVLTRFPQAFLQILVDCGVVIDSRNGTLNDVFGRVSIVTPTSACLVCMDEIDLERARAQELPVEELTQLQHDGYAPELNTRDPSVITYTSLIATFAVNELLSRLFGYCEDDPANRLIIRIGSRSISKMRRTICGNHHCGRAHHLASGLHEPLLRYSWRN